MGLERRGAARWRGDGGWSGGDSDAMRRLLCRRGGGGSHHEASVGRGFQTPRGTVGGVVDGMSSVGLD